MRYNRKSKKNLRPPWKPGQSGNPEGKARGNYGYKRRFEGELRKAFVQDMKRQQEAEEPVATMAVPTAEKKMPVELYIPCSVCRHEGQAVIDGLLTLGIPMRAIARSYGFSKSAVERHKRKHLPVSPDANKARQVKTIQEGLWKILCSRDGMRLSGCLDGARRALERLWNLNHETAIEEPLDRAAALIQRHIIEPKDWYLPA